MHNANNRLIEVTKGIDLGQIRKEVADAPLDTSLTLRFDHQGGLLRAGIDTHKALTRRAGDSVGIITGQINSAATLIYLGCKKRMIAENGSIAFHYPYWTVSMEIYENTALMEQNRRSAMKILDSIYQIFYTTSGMHRKKLRKLMHERTTLSAQEAVRAGLADCIYAEAP